MLRAIEQLGHPDPHRSAQKFLEYTDIRAGLIQASDAGDAYVFPHQTFQEYLAGLELVRDVDFIPRIMERRANDRWRVPILLGIGHLVGEGALAMPYQLLGELLLAEGRSEEQRQGDLIFAAEIVEDVGWDRLEQGGTTFRQLRRELARVLAQVVEGAALPAAERVRAGRLLGRLGDPRPGVCGLPPAMARIEGGNFTVGNTPQEYGRIIEVERRNGRERDARELYGETVNERPVAIATFEIGRYPVTNAQYKLFIEDGSYRQDAPWWDAAGRAWLGRDDPATKGLAGWQIRQRKDRPAYWDDQRFGSAHPNHPVVGVSWYEAQAFCRWLTHKLNDGYCYRLPSEAEWEYAARGPERRTYPWGEGEPDRERANFNERHNGTSAVGSLPLGATGEGLEDLAGNVWEWTGSIYAPYPYDAADRREDIDNPPEKQFILRGGSWLNQPLVLRASNRHYNPPDYLVNGMGFRLARHFPV